MGVNQQIGGLLPRCFLWNDLDPRPNSSNRALEDINLVRFTYDILRRRADEPVQVAGLDFLRIDDADLSYPNVRELLSDVTAAAAGADDQRARVGQKSLGVPPQEALPAKIVGRRVG